MPQIFAAQLIDEATSHGDTRMRKAQRCPFERISPDVRAAWLVTGIASHYIEDLHAAGYTAADIEALSAATGRAPMGYAAVLVGWY